MRDEATARNALVEALGMEKTTWPLPILNQGRDARRAVVATYGEPTEAVEIIQQMIWLNRRIGKSSVVLLAVLVDAQLASGDAPAAAATGQALLAQLEGSRNQHHLIYARVNVAAACLALDDRLRARPLLESGWSQTRVFDHMRPRFADYLALFAALDGRYEAAARLAGYADAGYVAFDFPRDANEAAAVERARSLARAALGAERFERLQTEGASLREEFISSLAFGTASR